MRDGGQVKKAVSAFQARPGMAASPTGKATATGTERGNGRVGEKEVGGPHSLGDIHALLKSDEKTCPGDAKEGNLSRATRSYCIQSAEP